MRTAMLFLVSVLFVTTSLCAEEGTTKVTKPKRVDFSCDLHWIKANPSKPVDEGLRNAVMGCGIGEWRIVQKTDHVYKISGIAVSAHTGFGMENVAIFLGNLDVDDRLLLLAKSNEKGEFVIEFSNQTAEQTRQAFADRGIEIFIYTRGKKPRTSEEIYTAHKYLYTGRSNDDLYRYEIPYDQAEPVLLP